MLDPIKRTCTCFKYVPVSRKVPEDAFRQVQLNVFTVDLGIRMGLHVANGGHSLSHRMRGSRNIICSAYSAWSVQKRSSQ